MAVPAAFASFDSSYLEGAQRACIVHSDEISVKTSADVQLRWSCTAVR
jgi:hypothetical protein